MFCLQWLPDMEQNQVESIETQLSQDRGASFRGTARIRFAHLHFGDLHPRESNKNITECLKEKFKIEGCRRLEPKNHIPAVISQMILDAAIEASPGVSRDSLLENHKGQPPELKLPDNVTIECLQGLHRIGAGKEVLARRDWWWTVDLYLDDASTDLKIALSEEYSNSVNFSDGEIFLKLREYNDQTNRQAGTLFAEKRMWGRLSRDKRKDLKQILGHKTILAGLDALRKIPALFVGFRIEHGSASTKCFEEISHYHRLILVTWVAFFKGLKHKEQLMRGLNPQTVELLQLRVPGCSPHDRSVVEKDFRDGKLFPAIQNPEHRNRVWENILSILHLIPSLYTLSEDMKYLKAPSKILRKLCPPSRFSTREAMYRIFTGCNLADNTCIIQDWESKFHEESGASPAQQFEFGYQQIWLYAWRHWTELVPECPRKEHNEDTPIPQQPDARIWHGIALLATKLGFESDEIDRLTSLDPDRVLAREALLKARNPEYFTYNESEFENYVTEISRIYKLASEQPLLNSTPRMLVPGYGESLERRCGRVFNNAYKNDRKHLFLLPLYTTQYGNDSGVSSFAVRASVYFAFFGRNLSTDSPVPPTMTNREPESQIRAQVSNRRQQDSSKSFREPQGKEQLLQQASTMQTAAAETTPTETIGAEPTGTTTTTTLPTLMSLTKVVDSDPIAHGSNEAANTSSPSLLVDTVDTEMTDYVPSDPATVIIKIWGNGKLTTYGQTIPWNLQAVEKAMKGFESAGYQIHSTNGRALKPSMCYEETRSSKKQLLIITKEVNVSRPMVSAINQWLRSRVARAGQKRKVAVT